jgi:RNA 3'-terminal phosphate cyclase
LLRLFEAVTNGAVIEISYTGTTISFKPGFVAGTPATLTKSYTHNCPVSKPIGYFLEPLLLLAAVGKAPTNIILNGVTCGDDNDPSVDLLRVGLLPVLKRFGIEDYELRVSTTSTKQDILIKDPKTRFSSIRRWTSPLYIPRSSTITSLSNPALHKTRPNNRNPRNRNLNKTPRSNDHPSLNNSPKHPHFRPSTKSNPNLLRPSSRKRWITRLRDLSCRRNVDGGAIHR